MDKIPEEELEEFKADIECSIARAELDGKIRRYISLKLQLIKINAALLKNRGIEKQMTKKYIHYGYREFIIEAFRPVKNGRHFNKPVGGMWASPVDAEFGWKQWNKSEHFMECDENNCFIFELAEGAKVYHIRSVEDYKKMPHVINREFKDTVLGTSPDFEELIRQGYDAVELHLSEDQRLYWELYGWDCDSILIMNPEIIVGV